jgi:haloalkane dehalogenase
MKNEPGWLSKEEYPFSSRFLDVDGHKMHYIDEGAGDTLLFVHGTPSWSFEYRKIIIALSRKCRCIAIDHIGFGLSDKPESYDYSPGQHSRNLEAFIKTMKLRDLTMVLHDFGGPIGLNYISRHPQNIRKIVLLNTWAWDPGKEINAFLLTSGFLAFLYKRLNFSPRVLLPASFGDKKPSKDIVRHYCKPFGNPSERNGPLAFARSLAIDGKWFDDVWKALPLIRHMPVLFVWGMKDRFINASHLDKLSAVFTHAIIKKLATAGHFPQEEEAELVCSHIKSFIEEKAPVHHFDPEME